MNPLSSSKRQNKTNERDYHSQESFNSNLSQELQTFKIFGSQRLETKRNRKRTIRVSWSSHFVVLTFQIALIFLLQKGSVGRGLVAESGEI